MFVNWTEVKKALYPMKSYEDLSQRLQESFSYPFICDTFNYTMPQLAQYTHQTIGADPKGRYDEYALRLARIFTALHALGIQNLLDLYNNVRTAEALGTFTAEKGIDAADVVLALKFLIYWFIPTGKYLGGIVGSDPIAQEAIRCLRTVGVRTSLDLLGRGLTAATRRELASESGLPIETVEQLVNRADFARMPWASKATISNIIGAGYPSLSTLTHAEPEKLYTDFFAYGKSIGKNLKLGNEIENSHRIAKILPVLIREE